MQRGQDKVSLAIAMTGLATSSMRQGARAEVGASASGTDGAARVDQRSY